MNVIGSRPDGWWRDREGAKRRLVGELEAFAAASGDEVAVIFDGKPFELDAGAVDVEFASTRGRDAADHDIGARAEADSEDLRVVTSDGALADRVRAAGAEVEGAGSFRRRLG
jgi:predicted RNA-binding protein with PIN domain